MTDTTSTSKDAPSNQNQQGQENDFVEVQGLEENHIEDLRMLEKNWVSWSATIVGCVQNKWQSVGLELFKDMKKADIEVSQSIYASLFRSCARLVALQLGIQMQGYALKNNFAADIVEGISILGMHAKCGCITNFRKLSDPLPKHSLQSYNAIIIVYAHSDRDPEALYLFRLLLRSWLGFDEISLYGIFIACASIKGDTGGHQIHGLVAKSKFSSNNCVINDILGMYGKCGVVSWNAIIAAYEHNGNKEETPSCFASMLQSCREPDEFTYGSALKVCAGLQTLRSGIEIHTKAIKSRLGLDPFVGGALEDMCCKCGKMEEACKIHDRTEENTIVSWNALIFEYFSYKQSEGAQEFFPWMLKMGESPDKFSCASILDTCFDLASISLGKQIHAQIIKREMLSDVYISSTLVDMYSMCGNFQDSWLVFEEVSKRDFVTWNPIICGYSQYGHAKEVVKLFEDMPFEANSVVSRTVLSICKIYESVEIVDSGGAKKLLQWVHQIFYKTTKFFKI